MRRAIATIAALGVAACLATTGSAWAQPALEQAVKAAFLTKFGGFVGWPDPAPPRVTICVQGDAAFSADVARAARQAVQLKPLAVQSVEAAARDDGCDILYAGGSSIQSVEAALQSTRGRRVLTITDSDRGSARGMIHFVVFQGRVRFHIDAAAASREGLSVDSRLLALALSVKK